VLCVLALLFCCVGVTHAADPQHTARMVKKAHEMAKETMKLKEECVKISTAAKEAAVKAQIFAVVTDKDLKANSMNTSEMEKKIVEGQELINNAMKAAKNTREVADKTNTCSDEI
ncbi:uncharacterized protein TM35_000311640, partial [Trypanosoma theileri]